MKRFFSVVLAAALLAAAVPAAGAVRTDASAAILMDAGSGRVLYESNAHQRRLIASVTKLMTALVALESERCLDEVVTVDPAWAGVEGSSIYLRAGEQLRLETLLYGLLLRSGNDAAAAVAGFCGGTEAFVARMNQKAAQLGMEDSSFANPSGLNAEGHYSTAYDMALLARACLDNPVLAEMVSTRSITLEGRSFTNHNKLLWQYPGCIGMKTGYTERAGRTLVSAARRDGLTLICVTLNDPSDWRDHAALFDYGFAGYEGRQLVRAGAQLGLLPVAGGLIPACTVRAGEGLSAALAPGEEPELSAVLDRTALEAPVEAGVQVGELVCSLAGRELARVPLMTGEAVPGAPVSEGGFHLWRNVFKN